MDAGPVGLSVGVISDTHGLLRPEVAPALRGVGHVLHAGDVGGPDVLAALARIAPLTAVRGNNDRGAWARGLPARATLRLPGGDVLVVHERALVGPPPAGVRVVVTGHSHRPSVEDHDGVLFVNPGSAGPRRFRLPVTVAILRLDSAGADATIVPLGG